MIKYSFTSFWSKLDFVTINLHNVADVQCRQTRIALQHVFDDQKSFIVFPIKETEGTSQLNSPAQSTASASTPSVPG